jgi:hypothetical protein
MLAALLLPPARVLMPAGAVAGLGRLTLVVDRTDCSLGCLWWAYGTLLPGVPASDAETSPS